MNLTDRLRKIVWKQGGYLLNEDVTALATEDRLRQILVRCNNCRFTCAAQDIVWLTGMIKRDNSDYVRDISLLASDAAYKLSPPNQDAPVGRNAGEWREEACGGAYDGFTVSSDADPGL